MFSYHLLRIASAAAKPQDDSWRRLVHLVARKPGKSRPAWPHDELEGPAVHLVADKWVSKSYRPSRCRAGNQWRRAELAVEDLPKSLRRANIATFLNSASYKKASPQSAFYLQIEASDIYKTLSSKTLAPPPRRNDFGARHSEPATRNPPLNTFGLVF